MGRSGWAATWLRTSVLGFGFLVACGGSASRDRHNSQPSSATGSAGDGEAGNDAGSKTSAGVPTSVGGGAQSGGAGPLGGRASAFGGSNPVGLGGTSAADSGGAAPALPLPPGCEARARTETVDKCSLAAYCDTTSQLTNCYRLDSARWQCQCETNNPERIYQIEDAPGLQACALTVGLCSLKESDLDLGKETCEGDETSGEGSCRVDLTCTKPIGLDTATDARASLVRFGSASCLATEFGQSLECGCTTGKVASDYDLLVEGDGPACRPLLDFCMSGDTPNFDGDKQCWLTNDSANDEGCQRTEMCAAPMPLTDDVSLANAETRYATCSPRVGGGAACYCSVGNSSFGFQLAGVPDAASCQASILNCDDEAVVEATGAVSCQPSSLTAYTDSCQADLSCVQAATVDEREIIAEGRLVLACARVEPGEPWWCSCASDQKTARFELGAAELSAWQVCNQAPAGCLEQLDVHLGPYGEFVQPPEPLP